MKSKIPVWNSVCMDCGAPIAQPGLCAECAAVRKDVEQVTRIFRALPVHWLWRKLSLSTVN